MGKQVTASLLDAVLSGPSLLILQLVCGSHDVFRSWPALIRLKRSLFLSSVCFPSAANPLLHEIFLATVLVSILLGDAAVVIDIVPVTFTQKRCTL